MAWFTALPAIGKFLVVSTAVTSAVGVTSFIQQGKATKKAAKQAGRAAAADARTELIDRNRKLIRAQSSNAVLNAAGNIAPAQGTPLRVRETNKREHETGVLSTKAANDSRQLGFSAQGSNAGRQSLVSSIGAISGGASDIAGVVQASG